MIEIYHKIFSYGSNHSDQLKQRIERDIKLDFNSGFIKNYTRIFAGFSNRWKGGVASIYPDEGSKVFGSVFYLSLEEIEKLDKFEGGYTRIVLDVMEKINGVYETTKAFVYVKNDPYFNHLPSEDYCNAIYKMLTETDRKHTKGFFIRGVDENDNIKLISKWVKIDM